MNTPPSRRDFLAGAAGALLSATCAGVAPAARAAGSVPVLDPTDPLARQIRFRPGHYLVVRPAERDRAMPAALRAAAHPGIRGIKARFHWSQLEKGPGDYDFSGPDRALADASELGKPLILFLGDKSFRRGTLAVPAYVERESGVLHHSRTGGTMPPRWNPRVKERFERLVAAIGDRYDAEPLLECLIFQETIVSGFDVGPDYSTAKYYATIRDRLRVARAHLPHAQVCQYVNAWLERGVPDPALVVGEYLREIRGMLGAPDVLPYQRRQAGNLHPHFARFNGVIPLCGAAQPDSYRHTRGDGGALVEMREILAFGVETMHLDHMVWSFVPRGWERYPHNTEDHAIAAIAEAGAVFDRDWKFSFRAP